jgi:hypothetical protein
MLPADRQRQERVAARSDVDLEAYISRCLERERTVKPSKVAVLGGPPVKPLKPSCGGAVANRGVLKVPIWYVSSTKLVRLGKLSA